MENNLTEDMATVNVTEMPQAPEGCLTFPLSTFAPWDQPEDLVSYSVQQTVIKVINVYLLNPFFIMSVPLNTINMIVFWKHGIGERINVCLFCLSLSDIVVIAIPFVLNLDWLYAVATSTPHTLVVAKFIVNNMIHCLVTSIYVSGFLSTVIALERCLCVVSPIKAQGMFSAKTTAITIAISSATLFGGYWVIASKWTVVCMFDPLTGQSVDAYYSSQFYINNSVLVDVLNSVVYGILLPGAFLLGVSISTIITIVKVRQMSAWRQQASAEDRTSRAAAKDMSLTRMLIGTNILFVVCTAPPITLQLVLPFVPDLSLNGKYYNTYYVFITLHQLCSYINSSFNFFVYYYFGTKFRSTVNQMFTRCSSRLNKQKQLS